MDKRLFVLGIDQGSTYTRAAVCDGSGRILGLGISAGACHSVHGMEVAMRAVKEAAGTALGGAGVAAGEARLLFGGFTGADWPDETPLLEGNLQKLGLAQAVRVVNDSIVALRGGTTASYGAIVVAGTGANCAVLAPDGRSFIYHYYVDDYLQGGMGLGRSALWAIYRAATGREQETLLTASVLRALGFHTVDDLLRAQAERRLSQDAMKGLAPLVFGAAAIGDVVASRILRSFGQGLADLVTAGLERFAMTGLEVEVVLSGSIFKGPGRLLHDTMAEAIRQRAPRAKLVNARYEPVVGALLLGLEACGVWTEAVEVRKNIEACSGRLGLVRTSV